MICLLCHQSTGEFLILASKQSKESKISSIVFKYFGFIFVDEPENGEICKKCWLNIDMFHAFYEKIEAIHSVTEEERIIVDAVDYDLKSDKELIDSMDSNLCQELDFGSEDAWPDVFKTSSDEVDNQLDDKLEKPHTQTIREPPKKLKRNVRRKKPEKLSTTPFKTAKCNVCLEYFLNEAQLLDHQKLTHLALPFRCTHQMCKESFETAELLEEHRKIAHAKVKCPHCPNEVLEHLLHKHIQRLHDKINQTICEHCGKVFLDKTKCDHHIRIQHDKIDRVRCDMCKGSFKDKYNLLKHIKIIHLEGPVVCSVCGKVKPNSKALRSHMRIHKEPDQECLVCGKRFTTAYKLREHSYIHTGHNAYECNFCGKKFRFSSSWSAHRMKYHPIEMAEAKQRTGERLKNAASHKKV